MALAVYEVDVPTTNGNGRRGVHIFTGQADSPASALRHAQEVHAAAVAAQRSGLEVPRMQPDGWGARGTRPGWEPDWSAATAGRWSVPQSFVRVCDVEA
ncbi:hypothetical protein [Streptomyces chiangmaiensis]|uniref:Uncharacterized protein n=1 Tax=Streptomyces chiangmaiensis TaxID=766497 RepID=A0ABU7FTK6_9ACTN|nr:hypothetical protein [Streptomyces chiangmaiensis]MED7827397.1 hypothetical protein [Streptomyces chiangmaiensis]